ncbi:GGDEF domain-containing protein [Kineosporia succinea]|uniref:Diguanylate cyclase (GGDEF)-like protein n=1 Tax=Kineosporia succinea TaxID=84632 RepID=A0ABT9P7E8_9ACTN|nr:GGDEF domain-containing protein [Kineosporia succinea]MDP9828105.1 diguanylate cyclase (GGDEF)-like protein [Kineosporia succinea]
MGTRLGDGASWTGRSDSTRARSRWMFGLLTLASTAFTTPHMLAASGDDRGLLLAALTVLFVSWTLSYRLSRVTVLNDVAEAAALTGVMACLDEPAVAFGFVFPMIWFRALYDSGPRVVWRVLLFEISLVMELPAAHYLGQPDDPHAWAFLLGGMTGYVASGLAGFRAGQESAARDAAAWRERMISEKGTQLLGLTDPVAIRQITWDALSGIVGTAPELRVLKVDLLDGELVVDRSAGSFPALPERLDASIVREDEVASRALDAAAGRVCVWDLLSFPGYGSPAYVLIGHPHRLDSDLLSAVRSVCNQAALAFQNSRVHSQLSVQALTDGLTGLANRQGFTEAVAHLTSTRDERPLAVLFIDLDDFKEVNDTLGHQAGDELLHQVARLLRSVTRADLDVVARLGGDEFAILLHNTSQQVAEQVAERIVVGVSVLEVASGLSVGASIGVAMASPRVGIDDLLVHADVAMYAAKAHGKGRIQAYHPGLLPT